MNIHKILILPFLIVAMLIVSACSQAAPEAAEAEPEQSNAPAEEVVEEGAMEDEMAEMNIVDIAVADGRFRTLVTALTAADLGETLQGEGPFTVFAPTDEAFAALPEGTVEALLEDQSALTDVLLYHVVPGEVVAADVVELESADTVQGASLTISAEGDQVMVNDAQIVMTDIEAANGVIHVIDAVLLPPAGDEAMEDEAMEDEMTGSTIVDVAVADEQFSTLVTALQAAGLAETLQGEGPFTVFAPTNDAFAKLPEGTLDSLLEDIPALTNILLFHVVDGKVMVADVVSLTEAPTLEGSAAPVTVDGNMVMIGEATVTATDIETSNGVIHVIDTVLIPQSE